MGIATSLGMLVVDSDGLECNKVGVPVCNLWAPCTVTRLPRPATARRPLDNILHVCKYQMHGIVGGMIFRRILGSDTSEGGE